jgi:hypothetical protein
MAETEDGFLARWSRRKLEAKSGAAQAGPEPVEHKPDGAGADTAASLPPSHLDPPAQAANQPPPEDRELSIEELPPIESINADTDLTPWLKRKVPEMWKQAALRRAWAADPVIATFIGPVENGWDWNAPDGVPGFGPLQATDNLAALLAQAIGAPREDEAGMANEPREVAAPASPSHADDAAGKAQAEAAIEDNADREAGERQHPNEAMEDDPDDSHASEVMKGDESDVNPVASDVPAGQPDPTASDSRLASPAPRRRGGGALPV